MNTPRTLLAAAALLGLAGTAQAQDTIQVVGQGENFAVRYAPEYGGNILGGGFVREVALGQNSRILYADQGIGQKAPGIPTFVGGQNGEVVYLPAPAARMSVASR